MINLLTNLLYYLSGWVIVFVVLSWIITSFYPLMSRALAKVKVEQAAFCVLMYGFLAPAAASVALIVLSFPNLAFSFIAEHCHGLDCTPHTLHGTLSTVQGIIIVAIVISLLIGVCTMIALQLFSGRNTLQTMSRLADPTSSYKVVDSNAAVAWCCGLIQPEIFISRGLAETLTAEQMQVVLVHEQTHVERKDNLRKWALHWTTIAWPKRYRMHIKQDLSTYTEHVCDLAAVRCQQQSRGYVAVMETLKMYYSLAGNKENDDAANDHKLRAQMLTSAWNSQSACGGTTPFARWLPTVFMSSLWLLAVIFAVHFGHPMLEWLVA